MKPKQFLKLFLLTAVLQIPVFTLRIFNILDITTCLAVLVGICFIIYVFYSTVNDEQKKALRNKLKSAETIITKLDDEVIRVSDYYEKMRRKILLIRVVLIDADESKVYETDKEKINEITEILNN